MSEAPKKIWVECYEDEDDGELDLFFSAKGHGEEYIRADIVEEMREALEMFQAWMTDIHTYTLLEVDMKAEAALKRLEEE